MTVEVAGQDTIEVDGTDLPPAVGEHLLAVTLKRSDAAAGAGLRVVEGDRLVEVPHPRRGDTLVVSVRRPEDATAFVGLQGREVPLSLADLKETSPPLVVRHSRPTQLEATIKGGEVRAPWGDVLTGDRARLRDWRVRSADLVARHPRLGWADDGSAWLVVNITEFSAPSCPRVEQEEARCDIDIPGSFAARGADGRLHVAAGHATLTESVLTTDRGTDVVIPVPDATADVTLVVQPTFEWSYRNSKVHRVVFPRQTLRVHLREYTEDQAIAERVILRDDDLTGIWLARPSATPPDSGEQARLERCLGRVGMQARETARARSDEFYRFGTDGRRVWTAVSLQASAEEAAKDLQALSGPRALDCVRASFERSLVSAGTRGSGIVGRVTFVERMLPGLTVPAVAWRATVVPKDPDDPTIYVDFVNVVSGRVMVEFTAMDLLKPVEDGVQVTAVKAMLARL